MAKKFMEIVSDLGDGVTPIVVGMILVNQQTLIPLLPTAVHLYGGWAIAIGGVVKLFQNFGK